LHFVYTRRCQAPFHVDHEAIGSFANHNNIPEPRFGSIVLRPSSSESRIENENENENEARISDLICRSYLADNCVWLNQTLSFAVRLDLLSTTCPMSGDGLAAITTRTCNSTSIMKELTFDYDSLPRRDIQFVKQTTREVAMLLEWSTGDIIAIGQKQHLKIPVRPCICLPRIRHPTLSATSSYIHLALDDLALEGPLLPLLDQ
jgi:hypothetical protein